MTVSSYRELKVWQLGMRITRAVYVASQKFPRHEVYGLTSQACRAAVSIPVNIAEGHARDLTKEFLHHVSIALGSLAELETLIILAKDLDYVKSNDINDLIGKLDCEGKMLRSLQQSLKVRLSSSAQFRDASP